MKRLFFVAFPNGKRVALEGAGTSPFFESKKKAKEMRDELNKGQHPDRHCHVAYGPDHWRNHGNEA